MTAYVKPIGILEENWVREGTNYIWDDLRYGRLKPSLLAATAYQGLEEILEPLIGQPDAEVLAKRWAGREESAIEEVDEILASAGLTMDAVMGQTLSINLDVIMQIYDLRTSAQTGLKLTMRELERRRTASGQHLGRAVQQPEEAELKVIAAETANTSPAE